MLSGVRQRVVSAKPLEQRPYYHFSVTEPFSSEVLPLIGSIISQQPGRIIAQTIHKQIAESLVRSWQADKERHTQAEEALKTGHCEVSYQL